MEALSERLHGRGTENEETIQKRLAEAENEISYKDRYKYNVVNDDLNEAVESILEILRKENC